MLLSCVVVGSTVDNLIEDLMQPLMHERGFTKDLISKKLMTFGANGVPSFQGTMLGVTKQIVDGWVPHSMGVHCMVHRTTLWFKFYHICKW